MLPIAIQTAFWWAFAAIPWLRSRRTTGAIRGRCVAWTVALLLMGSIFPLFIGVVTVVESILGERLRGFAMSLQILAENLYALIGLWMLRLVFKPIGPTAADDEESIDATDRH